MVQATETPGKLRGWVRALLIGSVTLNLIVAGVVVVFWVFFGLKNHRGRS